jgi:hypothetical protein
MAKQPSRQDEPAGFDKGQLKVCDLCGALNHASRVECFVCGWHGHFATDPETVHRAGLQQRFALPMLSCEDESGLMEAAPEDSRPRFWSWVMAFLSGLVARFR